MMLSLRPMPRWPLTRRSTFLVLFGLAYLMLGWSIVTAPPAAQRTSVATNLAPFEVWGCLWILCGLIAVITGALRWLKALGFAALMFIGFLWTIVSLSNWLAGYAPRGWVSAVIFGTISMAVYSVAGMVDNSDKVLRE